MESVWALFKKIHEKGLVYQGAKIMPYSTKCFTVLSNFEASSNYKDIQDPSVLITFPLVDEENTSLIAWTTTPWTLPSNLAAAVHPNLPYIKFKNLENGQYYIVAEPRFKEIIKMLKWKKIEKLEEKTMTYKEKSGEGEEEKSREVKYTMLGSELDGKAYEPLFEYFGEMRQQGCFRIIAADFVTSKDGTGIVHCAPGFGEEDFYACVKRGMIDPGKPPCPVDDSGNLTDPITDFKGMYFKDADNHIKHNLKDRGRLLFSGTFTHSYPFCWRTDTPLMYRAVKSWFIKVTDLKQDLIANNKKARWVPKEIQEG